MCCVEQRLAGCPLRGGRWRARGGGGQPQLRGGQQLHIQQGAPGRGRPTGEHQPVAGGNQQLPAAAAHRRTEVRRFDGDSDDDDNDDVMKMVMIVIMMMIMGVKMLIMMMVMVM